MFIPQLIDRTKKAMKGGDKKYLPELNMLERIYASLEEGVSARALTYSKEETEILKEISLLTLKPVIYAANVSEDDFVNGLPVSMIASGKEMLASPITPVIWRASLDNDRRSAKEIKAAGFENALLYCRRCEILEKGDALCRIRGEYIYAVPGSLPIMHINAEYRFLGSEGLTVTYHAHVKKGLPPLPRFGVEFRMPEGNERFSYFGIGPYESYIDKHHASRLGRFESSVGAHFEHYLKPQENMAHADTRWALVSDLTGLGLLCLGVETPFSVNCSHYTSRMLTAAKHDFELVPLKETVVNLDYRHNGIGSHSCGPELAPEYALNEEKMTFHIRLKPVLGNDVDPFAELYQNRTEAE